MSENFLISENLNLSSDLQPKKRFNWFKLMFNSIWISFFVVLFILAGRSLFAYWQIYRVIPVENVEFFAVFDKKSYQSNENWQIIANQAIPHYLGIEQTLWQELLVFDQYYWAVYWENSADIKAKVVLFSYTPLPQDLLDFLDLIKIPYVYDGKILLLNSNDLQLREKAIPDLLMLNNLCVGRWQEQSFSCDFHKTSVQVSLLDSTVRPVEKADVFNLEAIKNGLIYANNQLEMSEISQFLPESVASWLPILPEKDLSLLVFKSENPVFTNNWAMFLPEVDVNSILDQLQYQVAYENREIRSNPLADGSSYEDELLNYQTFSWLDENFNNYDLKKLSLDQTGENFLYVYIFGKNLILSSDKNLFKDENLFLEKSENLIHKFSTGKIFMSRDLLSEFFPWQFSAEWCPILKIEEDLSKQKFILCD